MACREPELAANITGCRGISVSSQPRRLPTRWGETFRWFQSSNGIGNTDLTDLQKSLAFGVSTWSSSSNSSATNPLPLGIYGRGEPNDDSGIASLAAVLH